MASTSSDDSQDAAWATAVRALAARGAAATPPAPARAPAPAARRSPPPKPPPPPPPPKAEALFQELARTPTPTPAKPASARKRAASTPPPGALPLTLAPGGAAGVATSVIAELPPGVEVAGSGAVGRVVDTGRALDLAGTLCAAAHVPTAGTLALATLTSVGGIQVMRVDGLWRSVVAVEPVDGGGVAADDPEGAAVAAAVAKWDVDPDGNDERPRSAKAKGGVRKVPAKKAKPAAKGRRRGRGRERESRT
jgi:hypothetical protein